MQISERGAHPHFHGATQIDECRGERYRPCNANAPPVVNGSPLTNCRRCQGHADQDCLVRWIRRSLLHFSWTRTKARHGELWLLVRANYSAIVGRRAENVCQRRPRHSGSQLFGAPASFRTHQHPISIELFRATHIYENPKHVSAAYKGLWLFSFSFKQSWRFRKHPPVGCEAIQILSALPESCA